MLHIVDVKCRRRGIFVNLEENTIYILECIASSFLVVWGSMGGFHLYLSKLAFILPVLVPNAVELNLK